MDHRTFRMVSREPATRWQDALPTGNGPVGALVYGHLRSELITLNHEALWLRRGRPEIPDISAHLSELRRMLDAGRYAEAAGFLDTCLRQGGYQDTGVDPYHPACAIELEMQTHGAFSTYRRGVEFETGEAWVRWQEGERRPSRDVFVSRADGVVVLRAHDRNGGPVSLRVGLNPHDLKAFRSMGSGQDADARQVPIHFETAAEGEWLSLTGRYEDGGEFGAVGRVVAPGGRVSIEGNALRVDDAREVLVLVALFANEAAAPAQRRLRASVATLPADYDALRRRHVELHRPLYRRCSLDLNAGPARALSNEELLLKAQDGEEITALVERMADFGRYLLVCSSAPGGLPANLQGVWNGDYAPAWASDYHNDENIQMNYWQALPGNLAETALPYFDYYDASLEDYRRNARAIFGCRGILVPISQSTHGLMHPGPWLNWTAGGAWLAQLYYDYWLFTGDRDFLRTRAVPFLREVALFYEDFLVEGPDGRLLFSPSLSPENVPGRPGASLATINATMDVALAREVLGNLCAACELLGIEAEGVGRWQALLAKLPPYEVNEDGALREWLHPDLPDNYRHRHLSHLYPLFPGFELTEESDPALFQAARVAVEKRLVIGLTAQTGWSLAHMANIYARLGEGDRALECLELLGRSTVGPNLFTYHNDWRAQGLTMFWGHGRRPPFQIDANLGISAAVLEMLLFSAPGMVKLLPALPSAWRQGRADGMRCRGGIEAGVAWDLDAGSLEAELCAARAQEITLKLPHEPAALECSLPAEAVRPSAHGPAYRQLVLPAGEKVRLTARFR